MPAILPPDSSARCMPRKASCWLGNPDEADAEDDGVETVLLDVELLAVEHAGLDVLQSYGRALGITRRD